MLDVIPESLYIPSTMPISSINAEQHFSTRGTEKSKELAHIYTTSQKILLMILPVNITLCHVLKVHFVVIEWKIVRKKNLSVT